MNIFSLKSLPRALVLATVGLFSSYPSLVEAQQQPVHQDTPFIQDYAVKYYWPTEQKANFSIASDRNGKIQVALNNALYHVHNGRLLYPGQIVPDGTYRFMKDKKIAAVSTYQNQLVYLTDQLIISNAWAGKLYQTHQLPQAKQFVGGANFQFLLTDGKQIQLTEGDKAIWKSAAPEEVIDITYQTNSNVFWVLGKTTLSLVNPEKKTISTFFKGQNFTSFDVNESTNQLIIGTTDGLVYVNIATKEQQGTIDRKLPATTITTVNVIGNKTWVGTTVGAFSRQADGSINYYYGQRWLADNHVTDIVEGNLGSVLVQSKTGLSELKFEEMTLHDKAVFFDKQVRSRHIRAGFNSNVYGMKQGDLSTGFLGDSDNDGLWTSMYLGGEVFRYAATGSAEALQNCRESLDAMERLFDINPVPGFPARSYERTGHIKELSDPERWQKAADKDWDWKATTSSDEAIGHVFVFGAVAELIDEPTIRNKAITLLDTLMGHIVRNNWYLIDYDNKPTQWGRWHPEYVNAFPVSVGDRKLNSSNIIGMLQTAYHFTKKEIYKEKAFELMEKHGYLENLMRPMEGIGKTDNADELAALLSDGWNHSDDEMYFLGYWGLYRYAFNDELKAKYREAILDHYESERPEKDGLWNIFTAITGTQHFDLKEAVWYLQEHPLDLITWEVKNSHRKDLTFLPDNFRKQTTTVVLPPDERGVQRHNGNMFSLDRSHGNGTGEYSAGDIWLLPYWMGRYLGVISPPVKR